MKTLHAVLAAALLSSPASAQSPEALRFAADAALIQAFPEAINPDPPAPSRARPCCPS